MIVSIETATVTVGCALSTPEGEVVAALEVHRGRRHAETLVPAIEFLCRQAQIAMHDLTAVVVDTGPGLFTGLRVGLATAKGLALARSLPVCGVSSLEVLYAGAGARPGERVAAVIDARRGELYAAHYLDGAMLVEPWVGSPAAVAAQASGVAFVVGDGTARYAAEFTTLRCVHAHPAVRELAGLGAAKLRAGGGVDAGLVELSYLRPPDAEVNWATRDT